MTLEPITLFFVVERVARMREAQRRYDAIASPFNHRQMLPLVHEVDALIIRSQKNPLYPEFLAFVNKVKAMRATQAEFSMVAEVERLKYEAEIDRLVELYTAQARYLNEQLRSQNIPLNVPVMANNRKKKGGRR